MLRQYRRLSSQAARTLFYRPARYYNNEVPKFDPEKDYYKILGVQKNSTDSDVKKAYYRLAKEYHPDSNPGKEAKFKEINEAYGVLSDEKEKRAYNTARSFTGFRRKMGSKASRGQYHYREYQDLYSDLSQEQQNEIMEEMRRKMRKVLIAGIIMIFVLPFVTRRPHKYFVMDKGELVPVEFEGGMAGGTLPPAGMMGPMGPPHPSQVNHPGGQSAGYYQAPQGQPYGGYQAPQGGYAPPQGGYGPQSGYQAPPQPYGNYRQAPGQ